MLVFAYAALAHYSNSTGAHGLGAALALAPLALIAAMLLWRRDRPLLSLLGWAALTAVLYAVWPVAQRHFALFSLVQESGVYLLLGLTFSRSLWYPRVALCTRLADRVHGPLSGREVRYTRQVTLAWAVFFFTVPCISLLLYVSAPLSIWSGYINFCVLPSVGAMFVVEQWVRRRVLPQVTRAGLMATLRVYLASPR